MKKLKRMNRKKMIDAFKSLRMGFRSAHDFIAKTRADKMTMRACHTHANNMVVSLGGESVTIPECSLMKKRKKL